MLIGYLVDEIGKIVLAVLAVASVSFIVSCVVILIGEKKKWW